MIAPDLSAARSSQPAHPVAYLAALAGVALATLAGLLVEKYFGSEPVVLLYIPAVLVAAIYAGLWPALLSAVAATLAYN